MLLLNRCSGLPDAVLTLRVSHVWICARPKAELNQSNIFMLNGNVKIIYAIAAFLISEKFRNFVWQKRAGHKFRRVWQC